MAHKLLFVVLLIAGSALMIYSLPDDYDSTTTLSAAPADQSLIERGRYVIPISGCNDCHTPGFMQFGEQVPESQWLTGSPIGWRGPWGTTYASNLRLFIKPFSADDVIKVARTRNSRPPMPWPSLHAMSDDDLRAVYAYIKSLGETGVEMPQWVPPGQEPKTPYLSLMPQMPQREVAKAATTQPIKAAQ
jgi:mono/diheme cytochrome c family protein